MGENQEEQFLDLQEDKESPAINADLKLSYTFYQLGRMIELKTKGKLLDYLVASSDLETERTIKDAKARQVTVIGETKWYTVKCRQLKVLLATDWNIPTCFGELPV